MISTDRLFEPCGNNKWQTTRDVEFNTRYGLVFIPEFTVTDLYSKVPNTGHPEFHLPPLLHDHVRNVRRPMGWSRRMTDIVFKDEMVLQSFRIYERLMASGVPRDKALNELWSLLRRSDIYYRGVSGIIGTIYMLFTED